MEKRALLAVVLSIAVFYAYSLLVPQPQKKGGVQQPVATATQSSAPSQAPAISPTAMQSVPSQPAPSAARDIQVDTDLYTAVFTTDGARLKRLVLKKYRTDASFAAKPVTLIDESAADAAHLRTELSGVRFEPHTLFGASVPGLTLKGNDAGEVVFSATTPDGYQLRKVFRFTADSYAIALDNQLANGSGAPVSGTLRLVSPHRIDPKQADSKFESYGPVTFSDGKADLLALKDVTGKDKSYDKAVLWNGFGDKYFLSAVLAKDGSIGAVQLHKPNPQYLDAAVVSKQFSLAPGQAVTIPFKLYYGPKDLDILKSQGEGLEAAIDFGWFSALAKPLLYAIKFFHRFVHNYGLAIIIITVILKLIFFPLTHKSYKSMKDMQKLQPKMTKIREKYKNDRDAMNREIMQLYQEHKVNPIGGCLPMLIQIPVFFALYKALMYSIELRHAPFALWITDLSAKDPYYVTPIIMGASMVIQQKMTPSQMDPMQQKMMMALPVVFTFMFLNFPSGLVIYWLVNNILTIGQQWYINKSLAD